MTNVFSEAAISLAQYIKEAEAKTKRQLRFRSTGKSISKIIEEECKKRQISKNELTGGGRRRKVSALRAVIAKRSLDELGLTMAEIARHVGVTTSSIAKAVARFEEDGMTTDSYGKAI